MESFGQVKEELVARSEIRTLDQFEESGRTRLKVIRADHIAEMIEGAETRARAEKDLEIAQLRAQLDDAHARLAQDETAGQAPAHDAPSPQAGPQAAPTQPTQGQPGAGGPDIANAVDQLSAAMNERLDQMSKKLGISTAVEADEVSLNALFDKQDSEPTESNIDDMEVKKKTSGGIGANLERLKKLKGND